MGVDQWIAQRVSEQMLDLGALVDQACEAAVTDPAGRGVRIDRYENRVEVSLSAEVPYGQVHDHNHVV